MARTKQAPATSAPAALPPIISVQEAARIMGTSEIWVLRQLNAGKLPGFKLNAKAWAVDRAACEKDIAEYRSRVASGNRGKGRPRVAG
jgi:hypothetical protein